MKLANADRRILKRSVGERPRVFFYATKHDKEIIVLLKGAEEKEEELRRRVSLVPPPGVNFISLR